MSSMVITHYNLRVEPFGVTPDPTFLFLSESHREAMAALMFGILSGRGFAALIAKPGMGKTSLLFNLLSKLKGPLDTAFLFQTLCGPEELLRTLLSDLSLPDGIGDMAKMHMALNEFLLHESQRGRQLLVVIDEAQNLSDQALEVVRMLSNFETSEKKLMHVVLAGQPQLAERLGSENLLQLRQRISIIARLTPFNADETRQYIEYRLRVAGLPVGERLFTGQAYSLIADYSRGIPRTINNLCFNAMALGCALKRQKLDALIVREAIDDLGLDKLGPTAVARENLGNVAAAETRARASDDLLRVRAIQTGRLDGRAEWIKGGEIDLGGAIGNGFAMRRRTR